MEWKFETYVEKIKFDVLREVARACYAGNFKEVESKIPEILIPGRKPAYRCCVYMERAIMAERVKIARGGEWDDFNIIDVIPIACDQCPMGGYTVTESCRSCIGHACKQACPKNAISIDAQHRAHIDKDKCVNCGLCAKACPFGAIYNFRRPCQKACPVGAITMDENLSAKVDYSKCISCGACTQKCPFGAIASKTFVTFVIDHIRSNILATKKRPIFAIVAPSIAAQFNGLTVNQIVEGIMKLGFTHVVEAAIGADAVTIGETKELVEKKLLTSSCCPAFVGYILKFYPELKDKISHSLSPMAQTGKIIKEKYPDALTVFIGPCTAKKDERSKPEVRPYVDYVLTFVELRAMFAARDIEVEKLTGIPLDNASCFGRNYARSGGLTDAVVQALKELNIKDFQLSPLACSGMRECIKALENLSLGTSKANFIEGMACDGGCICGPESLNHNPAVGKAYIQSHARASKSKTISDSISKTQTAHYDDAETLLTNLKKEQERATARSSKKNWKSSFSSIPFKYSSPESIKAQPALTPAPVKPVDKPTPTPVKPAVQPNLPEKEEKAQPSAAKFDAKRSQPEQQDTTKGEHIIKPLSTGETPLKTSEGEETKKDDVNNK